MLITSARPQTTAAAPRPPGLVDPPQPVPRLQRPVLLIAGGSSKAVGLPEVIHYLTHGGNNTFSSVYNATRRAEFEESYRENPGNVFTLQFSKNFASFDHNAGEIQLAVEDIRRVTGADEIDVVAECKGAIEARTYLSQRPAEDGIRNLVTLVPPNHGLVIGGDIAWTVAKAVEKLHLPIKSFQGYPLDNDSFTALSGFSTDWSLGPWHGNQHLHGLNTAENKAHESQVLNSLTVISGEGKNLLEGQIGPGLPLPLMKGDHSIPNWSAFLPHAQNFFYDGERAHHGQVKSHPEALAKMAETLVTDGHPAHDSSYCSKQPGVGRVMLRSVLWTAGLAGRANLAVQALQGQGIGPVGVTLASVGAGLAVLDGARQAVQVARDTAPQGRLKASIGTVGKLASAAGVAAGLAGLGWPAAALILGGITASALTA